MTKAAAIDATGLPDSGFNGALAQVAGMPVVMRLAKMLVRYGCDTLHVDGTDVAAMLRKRLPEEVAISETSLPGAPTFRADAVYLSGEIAAALEDGRPPVAAVVVKERSDVRLAQRCLEDSIKKSVQADGVLSFYGIRPLTLPITRVLLHLPITPNHVTTLAMLMGFAAAILVGDSSVRHAWVIAGVLFFASLVVDHIDGQIARLKLNGSRLGEWLDAITDDVTTFAVMAGCGIGMYRLGFDRAWMLVAVGGAIACTIAHFIMYMTLARRGGAIDIADYPWWFGKPSDTDKEASLLGTVVGYLARRDTFATVISLLLILELPRALVLWLFVRSFTVVPLLLLDYLVKATRKS